MTIITRNDSRRVETPNAVMTTVASPTLGGSELSMWSVEMAAGARGPRHVLDREQVWWLHEGRAEVEIGDDEQLVLTPGDTVVLAAGAVRRVTAATDVRFVVCGRGDAVVSVDGESGDRGTPPWIA